MKRDKARAITQHATQTIIVATLRNFRRLNTPQISLRPTIFLPLYGPRSQNPFSRPGGGPLHHYDPTPVRRAVAKKRRWRI